MRALYKHFTIIEYVTFLVVSKEFVHVIHDVGVKAFLYTLPLHLEKEIKATIYINNISQPRLRFSDRFILGRTDGLYQMIVFSVKRFKYRAPAIILRMLPRCEKIIYTTQIWIAAIP